jgi:hypothetical protein
MYLPKISGPSEVDIPIKPAPSATLKALARMAPLRPHRSIKRFATELPSSPPNVNTEVTTENVVSVMGMQSSDP